MRSPEPVAKVVDDSDDDDRLPVNAAKANSFDHFRYKRPLDGDMSTAYGNATKRSRQTMPSRAVPVPDRSPSPDMDIDDIDSVKHRRYVERLKIVVPGASIKTIWNALRIKKFQYDDAADYLTMEQEGSAPIDLTVSDDELTQTPAVQKNTTFAAKQKAKVPTKSIATKWSKMQNPESKTREAKEPKRLEVFSPPKAEAPRKRRLIRGRKERSSPDLPDLDETEAPRAVIGRKLPIILSDSEDEGGESQSVSEGDNKAETRLLRWFNACTAADLADTANIKRDIAAHFIAQQPFRSVAAIEKVDDPNRKPPKGRGGKKEPIGVKIADKVAEMLDAYAAVDVLVAKCGDMAKPLAKEMQAWGVNTAGAGAGELDLATIPSPGHDSGIGTPTEDDRRGSYFGQPKLMNEEFKLKDYQIVGMNWLNLLYTHCSGCILADDMGLGKTYQVIAFLTHLFETGEPGPHLVVVPSATFENWLMEFKRFAPVLTVEPYYSTVPGEREIMRYNLEETRDNVNVVVTTYAIAKAKDDAPWLRQFGFTCTIFDEGHVLKNADSLVTKSLARIGSKFRVLLTGTPLQNNLRELISLLAFMMPDLFKSKKEQLRAIFEHNVKALDENQEALLSAQRIARARSMLTPFILRRKKDMVLKDLPPKVRRVEYCDLTPEQSEIYFHYHDMALDIRLRRERGEKIKSEQTTTVLMKLRQASIHPFLFRRVYKDSILPRIAKACLKDPQWAASSPDLIVTELDQYSDMEVHDLCSKNHVLGKYALKNDEWLASGKVQKTLELLRRFIDEGSRVLIFSHFTMVLDILELVLSREKIKYFRLDGSTKVDERQDLIDTFTDKDNDAPVFMLSTKAGGAGINLATANKVIIFDSGFNPQDDVQAENRAHRIGQTKPVEVVRLVSRHTVEEAIYKLGLTKVELDQRVAGNGTHSSPREAAREAKPDDSEAEAEGEAKVAEMFFANLDEQSGKSPSAEDAAPMQTSPKKARPSKRVKDEARSPAKVEDDSDDVKELKKEDVLPARSKRNASVGKESSQSSMSPKKSSKRNSHK
jgi:SWI/SNF-related matrix-associated actin-dependent regulator of chromatin subfamily A containing DEAD/H box 1